MTGDSWLANPGVTLRNLRWLEDEFGDYWIADFDGGITGNYYDVQENGKRPPRVEQEAELRRWGKL